MATPFELRPYPVELQLCQRYYQSFLDGIAPYILYRSSTAVNYGSAVLTIPWKVPVRTTNGTLTLYTSSGVAGSLTINFGQTSSAFITAVDITGVRIHNNGALATVGEFATILLTYQAEL